MLTPAHPRFGTVAGEKPAVVHRLGTIAGRSCCGKAITLLPDGSRPGGVVCRRCVSLEESRRDGMPPWDAADEF